MVKLGIIRTKTRKNRIGYTLLIEFLHLFENLGANMFVDVGQLLGWMYLTKAQFLIDKRNELNYNIVYHEE